MRPINILLVEDDTLDAMDIKRSLDKLNVVYSLDTAGNGEEALKSLSNRGAFCFNELPDVVLIEINMPKINCFELLEKIRSNADLKNLKCFVITTSDARVDRQAAERLGISGYIVKPFKLGGASLDAFNLMIDILNFKSAG